MKKVAGLLIVALIITALPLRASAGTLTEEQEKAFFKTWKNSCISRLEAIQSRLPEILEASEFLENYYNSCSAKQSPEGAPEGMFSSCYLYEMKTNIGVLALRTILDVFQAQIDMCTCRD